MTDVRESLKRDFEQAIDFLKSEKIDIIQKQLDSILVAETMNL